MINIDADFVPDSVFWAVDNEAPLTFKEGEGEAARSVSTNELVERLLDPTRGHYQLAVLGPAGTGKSHLIHRIRQRVQGRPGFEILAVRRLETNLRAILEKLIDRLPADRRDRYHTELKKAGPALSTPEVQRGTLLDSLAQAIEEDVRRPDSGIDPELEDALLAALPNMFRDPYLRKEKFLKLGEVVPELVDRLFSSREGKRLEERVLFERSNLPLDGIALLNCSMQAREAIEIFLYDSDRYIPATLDVINRSLDRAIARALNFSGDQLGNLMGEIRSYLKTRDKELVILFEEFARLQGYDASMLAALLVQGGDTLCNVRWALACTTGRFRELPDTVRTRMDGIIDMEGAPPKSRPSRGVT
ncbi:ATP-binding protein [Microvirga alba]|uniref:ATP-binding protein n=1 Tax=Microvirga alba TaxID=2791025 RepID=A0A931FS09_9HYPH|nr:ATP-binding protein [Microvirga alba]MBF9235118.1 ATP-binding protein [Microvirga alba]